MKNLSRLPIFILLQKFWVLVLLLLFCGLFFFSTMAYQFDQNFVSYTLLFPSASSKYDDHQFSNLYAEQRKIPIPQVLPEAWSKEERQLYYLAKELLYGPGSGMVRSYPFMPSGTYINSLALQDGHLYLDFNENLLTGKSEHYFNTEAILALVEKVLHFNFPQLQNIYFSIESIDLATFQQLRMQEEQEGKAGT